MLKSKVHMFKMQKKKKKKQITNQNTAKPVLFKMQTKNKKQKKKKTDKKSNYSKTSGKQINVTKIRMC